MSGGSYNYFFNELEEFADDIRTHGSCDAAPPSLRVAFKAHVRKVAYAAKAIEWNDSCDGDEDEDEEVLIRAVLGEGVKLLDAFREFVKAGAVSEVLREELDKVVEKFVEGPDGK